METGPTAAPNAGANAYVRILVLESRADNLWLTGEKEQVEANTVCIIS